MKVKSSLRSLSVVALFGFTLIWINLTAIFHSESFRTSEMAKRSIKGKFSHSTLNSNDGGADVPSPTPSTESPTPSTAVPLPTPPEVKLPTFNNEFYLLTMLSIFNGAAWSKYKDFSPKDLKERDNEYLETLKVNSNNEYIREIHLFYTDDESLEIVKSLNLPNIDKIYPVKWHRRLHMADFFLYASRNLVNKSVIASNADIIIGGGLNHIDTERLRDERVMYSLTRHNIIRGNKTCTPLNLCTETYYRASHDTHIFRLAEPLNETLILDKLDYPINMWGAENVWGDDHNHFDWPMIAMHWTFKFELDFVVRNPCRVIYTHHNHCSKVHGPSLEKVHKHKYSIYFLPGKGWNLKRVIESYSPFEDTLRYREAEMNSTINSVESQANSVGAVISTSS